MSELEHFRKNKDEFFRTDHHSPLTPEQKQHFTGLNYFSKNPDLDLTVEVERFDKGDVVQIQTNTGDVQTYERFGRFNFTLEGEEIRLSEYEPPESIEARQRVGLVGRRR